MVKRYSPGRCCCPCDSNVLTYSAYGPYTSHCPHVTIPEITDNPATRVVTLRVAGAGTEPGSCGPLDYRRLNGMYALPLTSMFVCSSYHYNLDILQNPYPIHTSNHPACAHLKVPPTQERYLFSVDILGNGSGRVSVSARNLGDTTTFRVRVWTRQCNEPWAIHSGSSTPWTSGPTEISVA